MESAHPGGRFGSSVQADASSRITGEAIHRGGNRGSANPVVDSRPHASSGAVRRGRRTRIGGLPFRQRTGVDSINERRNVLIIGVDLEEFAHVAPFLARDAFDVDRFPSGTGALELTAQVAIEVLLVRYPLPDMDLGVFLQAVRQGDSPCLASPILLLAAAGEADEAEAYVGRGANRVLRLEDAAEELQETVSGLLAVAPRKAARFLARMEIKLGGAKDMILCQTENLSASGMLIRTERRYDKGTKIDFEFSLPDDTRPIVGVAEVMRHTIVGRDKVGGIGVRFLSFGGDSQRRFATYLQQL